MQHGCLLSQQMITATLPVFAAAQQGAQADIAE